MLVFRLFGRLTGSLYIWGAVDHIYMTANFKPLNNHIMTTTMIRFNANDYVPFVIINLIEKLEDMFCVREVVRPAPCGIMFTTKTKRGMKKVLHTISLEMKAMKMEVIIPAKDRKYNPYF